MNRIMVLKGGSPALHKLGDIGRECDDYIRISSETEDYYVGCFEEGFGFVGVKFRKEDCRPLTKKEIDEMNTKWFTISGNPVCKMNLDYEGNIIPWTAEEIIQNFKELEMC